MSYRDLIFKGATRPAMMAGVPTVPFILVIGIHIILAMWAFSLVNGFVAFVILAAGGLNIGILRYISTQDDQRLNQYMLRMKSVAGRRNSAYWGAHGISPVDFAKRK